MELAEDNQMAARIYCLPEDESTMQTFSLSAKSILPYRFF